MFYIDRHHHHHHHHYYVVECLSVSIVSHINEVVLRQARLVLEWVTISGFNSQCTNLISVSNHPAMSTQPGHPSVGRCNEYPSVGGDALQLGINAGRAHVWQQVKLWSAGKTACFNNNNNNHKSATRSEDFGGYGKPEESSLPRESRSLTKQDSLQSRFQKQWASNCLQWNCLRTYGQKVRSSRKRDWQTEF